MSGRNDASTKPTHSVEYSAVNQDADTEYLPHLQHMTNEGTRNSTTQYDQLWSLYNKVCTFWVNGWTSEVLSCSLAVVALVCLIATLSRFNGNVLTEMPLALSVNTLIAIFTAVIKSALLLPVSEGISQLKWTWFSRSRALIDFDKFDLASRGPWGSLLLVFRLQSRHFAAIGAWITILALAIDPFTQQMIRPVICDLPSSNGAARISRANNITAGGLSGTEMLDSGLLKGIYTGLISDTPAEPRFQCPTGNCTFPFVQESGATYQSLAIESACVNVTKEVSFYENNSTSYFYLPAWGNYTTGTETDFMEVLKTRGSQRYQFPQYWPGASDETNIFSFVALMWGIDWIGWNDTSIHEGITDYMRPLAVECSLWPTLQTINGSVTQSKLEEHVIASEHLYTVPGEVSEDDLLHISSSVLRNGVWSPCDPSPTYTSTTPLPIFNNTLWRNNTRADARKTPTWYADDCVWYINGYTHLALSKTLHTLYSNKSVMLLDRFEDWSKISGEIWMRDFYQNGTLNMSVIETNVARLASSMTAAIRNKATTQDHWRQDMTRVVHENDERGWVYGHATTTATCIHVQWGWLAYPASLVALTMLFVALSAWRTRQGDNSGQVAGIWKSTSLAVLFGGLDESARKRYGLVSKAGEMHKYAEDMKVSLRRTESGWRLVESGTEK